MKDDLKNWQEHSGFDLLTSEEALGALVGLLGFCLLLDRLGVWK